MIPYGVALLLLLGLAGAADAAPEQKQPRVPTPEESREKASRRACKIAICDVFASREPEGDDVACKIVKTWREEDIEDIVSGGRLDWPWGKARCTTDLALERKALAEAMDAGEHVVEMRPHVVACSLDRKSEGLSYDVKLKIAPVITFKQGRAVKAQINWGEIEAPMLAYGALWPGAKLDNGMNVLDGKVTEMVNEFVTTKCKEVRHELPSRKPAE